MQGFQRAYFDGGGSDLVDQERRLRGQRLPVDQTDRRAFEPQILWIQSFKDAGGLIRPRLNWYAAKNTTLGFGVDIFTGPSDGYFGRYNNRDRVYSELRYDFWTPSGSRNTKASRLTWSSRAR